MTALRDLLDLTGRVAVVTGGTGPLGLTLVETLLEQGAQVVAVDRPDDERSALAAGLGEAVTVVEADLRDPAGPASVVAAVDRLGRLDVLVNNAAFTGTSGVPGFAVPFDEQTDAAFTAASDLNLRVPFTLTRMLAGRLRASGHGSVVNVCSIYGLVGPNMRLYDGTTMGNPAAYAATKGGLAQLTRYLSTVLAPDVRVNGFAPGGIARGQAEAFVERYEKLTPLGRMATEDDFRGALAWLASDASAFVTGQVVAVDGGWTAW
jgi:NAD(P)-dependent dehydrogenase (short-subunit alcohol dehydrogenase family)